MKGVHIGDETNYQFITGDDYAAQYCTCYSLGGNNTKYCCFYTGVRNYSNNRADNKSYNRAHHGAYH